jgi:Protein of unknown function (DUF2911)
MFTPPTPSTASARRFISLIALATIAACASTAGGSAGEVVGASVSTADAVDSAVFVTRLGVDTMAIERVVYAPRRVEADVLLRTPVANRTPYVLDLSPTGDLTRLESLTRQLGVAEFRGRQTIVRVGDSLRVDGSQTGHVPQSRTVAAPDGRVLPFIDVVHWPFELALLRARASGRPQTAQPLLSGNRVTSFPIVDLGPDSMTITHPARGTMRVRVDVRGRLLVLDAGATTRKLLVERRPWMSDDAMSSIASRWSDEDRARGTLLALSGRAQLEATVAGARIGADYGTPSKRGREIWGKLVPFGQVWRTGANQATHFTTDRDLVLGTGGDTLLVPAGRYTLFSVPQRDGGLLIVSRQTGQAGTAYDPAHDLGRVRLTARSLPAPVEVFTIAANPEGADGVLRLQWDRTELVTPFRVR